MRGDPKEKFCSMRKVWAGGISNTVVLKTSAGTISILLKTYSLKFSSISPPVPEKDFLVSGSLFGKRVFCATARLQLVISLYTRGTSQNFSMLWSKLYHEFVWWDCRKRASLWCGKTNQVHSDGFVNYLIVNSISMKSEQWTNFYYNVLALIRLRVTFLCSLWSMFTNLDMVTFSHFFKNGGINLLNWYKHNGELQTPYRQEEM